MSILDRLGFRRKHKHKWEYSAVYSGAANTVKVKRCLCGLEIRELTPAGHQQIGWWLQLGLSLEEAHDGVLDGSLPSPLVSVHGRWDLVDTR